MTRLFFRRNKHQPDTNHPAYAVGEQLGHWFLRQEQRLANALNSWQSRVSSRLRNVLLMSVLVAFAIYFIWLFIKPA